MLEEVFSLTKLLREGKEEAFALLLKFGPPLQDWKREEYVQVYYSNLWKLVANFRYARLEKVITEYALVEIGKEELEQMKEKFYFPVTNPNLEDEDLLSNCEIPLRNVLISLYSYSPPALFAILAHHMNFEADKLASKYRILEYNFSMDSVFIDVCSLLLMGYCIYNSGDNSWYSFQKKIWEKVDKTFVAVVLLVRFSSFTEDLCSTLQDISNDLEEEEEKKSVEDRKDFYRSFGSKKSYLRLKSYLEPLEIHLRSKLDIRSFNKKEYEFATFNGVVDLSTGILREYQAIDYLLFHSPISYIRDKQHDEAEARLDYFLNCFTSDKGELKEFLQTYLGYCITGLVSEQTFLVMRGKGSNSKSILFNLFQSTLGEYYSPLPRCVIVEGKFSAGQATPQLEKLTTCRLGGIAELKKKSTLEIENIKNITGGDAIPSRGLFKGYENIRTATKLIVITNEMSRTNFQYSYARRVIMFPCQATFIRGLKKEESKAGLYPVIFGFNEKMQEKKVSEAFLRFLVEGSMRFYEMRKVEGYEGIPLPEEVKAATESYLASINEVGRFIMDITEEETKIYSEENMWENFKTWYFKYLGRECLKSFTTFQNDLEEIDIKCLDGGNYVIQGSPEKRGKKPRYTMF